MIQVGPLESAVKGGIFPRNKVPQIFMNPIPDHVKSGGSQ